MLWKICIVLKETISVKMPLDFVHSGNIRHELFMPEAFLVSYLGSWKEFLTPPCLKWGCIIFGLVHVVWHTMSDIHHHFLSTYMFLHWLSDSFKFYVLLPWHLVFASSACIKVIPQTLGLHSQNLILTGPCQNAAVLPSKVIYDQVVKGSKKVSC
jgi:hypothetical protein